MAYFQEIAHDLKKQILAGKYQKEDALPTQKNLAQHYQTSRVTIQKALNLLKIQGWIMTVRGLGSFVVGPNSIYDYEPAFSRGMTYKLGHLGELKTKLISFEISTPNEIEQEKLMLSKDDLIYDIVRLRIFEGEPLALEYTIMPVALIPNLTLAVLSQSIYGFLTRELGYVIGKTHRKIKADRCDAYDQRYLDSELNDPILEFEQVVYLDSGIPFEYSQTRHRYDKGDVSIVF